MELGQGVGRGQVFERFEQPVEQRISGALVRRNGSSRNPAFLIRTDSGEQVLKLASELSRS